MILIDPPTWPAHGTVFSHLVSDSSLNELHSFAQANHLSERAFDLDHYDVPANLYDILIEAGAHPVTGSELTKRLIRSGLRVPLKERPAKIRGTLLKRWDAAVPGYSELGEHVLDQWEQPHRGYHNSAHLLEMLDTLEKFYAPKQPPRAVLLAAWLHDVVYDAEPGKDEEKSAEFAQDVLTPLVAQQALSAKELDCVVLLVETTKAHQPIESKILSQEDTQYFLDADLAILAAETNRYNRYVAGVRREYSRYTEKEFTAGRAQVLKTFTKQEHIFSSQKARDLYEKRARLNLENELLRYS